MYHLNGAKKEKDAGKPISTACTSTVLGNIMKEPSGGKVTLEHQLQELINLRAMIDRL
jgi:hypothetical protein